MKEIQTIFCDLDGIFIRRYSKRPQMANQEALSEILALLAKNKKAKELQFIFVTDRPASHIAPFVWMLNGARYHAGESGGVVFDRNRNIEIIAPEYLAFNQYVKPLLYDFLRKKINFMKISDGPFPEPGGKKITTSIEPPLGAGKDFGDQIERVMQDFALLGMIRIEKGSAPAISPRDLDKAFAFDRLVSMYKKIGQEIDITRSIWIADGERDIPFGEKIIKEGGIISAVGNSSESYLNFVSSKNGIIVEEEYEKGVLQIIKKII